jgi:hypothetical protein
MMPEGVAEPYAGSPIAIFPKLAAVTPSTSFRSSILSKQRRSSMCAGTGCCRRMPWTSGFAFNVSISPSSSSVVRSYGMKTFNDSIPTRAQAFPFILTYVAEAGSSPTNIVASTGGLPFELSLIA